MRRKAGEAWRRDTESLAVEFLKEHRKVEQQEATITQLKKDFRATVAELNARLKEQASKIEKVSAEIEMSRTAPQRVANDQ
jgi:phage shock protein A